MNNRATVRNAHQGRGASYSLMAVTVAVVAAVAAGLFMLNWWVFEFGINKEAEIRRGSFNYQETARERVVDLNAELTRIDVQLAEPSVTDAQSSTLAAQRTAVATSLCETAADITGTTSVLVSTIITKEC